MFVDEAKIAVQLAHSNIGKVFELGQVGDAYSMEFVSGRDNGAIFDRIGPEASDSCVAILSRGLRGARVCPQ